MLYFVEYMQAGSGVPVDLTMGLRTKKAAIIHGRKVASTKGYCGFWVSTKPAQAGVDAIRIEFHPVHHSPNGKVRFGNVIIGALIPA